MTTSHRAIAATLAVAASAAGSQAFAEEKPVDETHAEIMVLGQREAVMAIPARGLAVSLGREQLDAVNASNTEDLIKYAPNFFVRKRYAGDSNGVPGFRGTHSTQSARTLVMVDGFVVSNFLGNSFNFAPKWGVVGPGEVEQFDVVYGPYSARFPGNAMGGIVDITTRAPRDTEAFANVQEILQPYSQFGAHDTYEGGSLEAGIGLRQKEGPWSLRVSGRHFRNTGQPMSFLGLTPVSGSGGVVVTGAVVDPEHERATADGTGIPGAPGNASNPYFAAQSPARIRQDQAKARIGYDDGSVTGEALLAFWHNEDNQTEPVCFLKDEAGEAVCEGRVRIGTQSYTASGATFSRTLRDELLAGLRLSAPIAEETTVRLAASTYQILRSDGFTSASHSAGVSNGAGNLARQGPTGWWTTDVAVENKTERRELALGISANAYRTDQTRYKLTNWQSAAGKVPVTRTFGRTRLISAWAEARLPMGPLKVTVGARHDDWRAYDGGLQANRYPSRHNSSFDPSLSIEYGLGDGMRMQLSLATATRYPTVGEMFQGSLNGDGSFNSDSFDPNLKPERSRDANLLIARDFGPVRLTGSVFYQRVRNTIFSFTGFNQNGVTTSNFKNIELTRQVGTELIAEARDWPIQGMDIDLNGAWIDSRTLRNPSNRSAEGVQFPRIPRWRTNGHLRYSVAPSLQVSVGARFASRPNTDLFGQQRGDTFGFTSELFALDARVNWSVRSNLRLSAGVDNLTNDRAWVFHPYSQRTFFLEAGWTL